jgi:mono/diheme cytochrome c family protein
MRNVFIAIFVTPLFLAQVAQAQTTPQGDPQKGRAMFSGQGGGALCMLCHGFNAQGGFGPDLAGGRGLTFDQFKKAVHEGWGVMPHYSQINDEGLANLYAFLKSLKPVAEPGKWSVENPPPGAPLGQVMAVNFGCAQCHGPEMGHPRRDIGGKGIDFAEFKEIVWEHAPPTMGQFRKERFTEPVLKELWGFMQTQGFRALLFGAIARDQATGDSTKYTVTLDNQGVPGKGITAEDIMVNLIVPKGLTVASTTGGSYQGLKKDMEYAPNPGGLSPFNNPNPNLSKVKGDIAVWKVAKVAPGQKEVLTITLSGPNSDKANFTGTTFMWAKPKNKRIAGLIEQDHRLAEAGDIIYAPSLEISLPPAQRPAAPAPAAPSSSQR